MNTFRTLFLVLVASQILGCSTIKASKIDGSCYRTNFETELWSTYDNVYVGPFLLGYQDKPELTDDNSPVGVIGKNTSLEVQRVIKGGNGSRSFLRIQLKVLDGLHQGKIVDIPTCASYHPLPKWIKGCTLDPNQIAIDSNFLSPCEI
ncbi:hypothetical protein GZ78_10815 [Endozoicomonas numazuensis]|uniref:Uncharacterized protein n=2 Tax=Endozoicomonas numazuensis TaxID=1137799 RepID=A0A081NHZ0_9GAMM|nr:hypothetical protein GZ78_10815 [Endozoicomonas numazuensis]